MLGGGADPEATRTKEGSTMEVQFRRTADRRYAITIYRKDLPPVEMNPAPGYDSIMPSRSPACRSSRAARS